MSTWESIDVLSTTAARFTISDYEGTYIVDAPESDACIVVWNTYNPSFALYSKVKSLAQSSASRMMSGSRRARFHHGCVNRS